MRKQQRQLAAPTMPLGSQRPFTNISPICATKADQPLAKSNRRSMRPWTRKALLLLLLSTLAFAKPSLSPTLEEGVAESSLIVVGRYKSHRQQHIDYLGGATATYQIVEVLKGKAPSTGLVALTYAFHDGSACVEPEGWTFSEKLMPQVGSTWILLLQPPGTYRGSFGRIPASQENLARVNALLGHKR